MPGSCAVRKQGKEVIMAEETQPDLIYWLMVGMK
jgi:hypothetical protein